MKRLALLMSFVAVVQAWADLEPLLYNGEGLAPAKSGMANIPAVGDGVLDLVHNTKNCGWLKGTGCKDGAWQYVWQPGDMAKRVLAGHSTCPTRVDFDGDGRDDILLGAEDGRFYLLKR